MVRDELKKVIFKNGKIVVSGHLSRKLNKKELEKQIRELEKQINIVIQKIIRGEGER